MKITVFGSSQPKEGDPAYKEAYELGKLLAMQGHTVLTGGYIGTMEAVSRGAAEAGGHVIGVTCADIEAWRPVKPNAWVQEERRFNTLQERLNELIMACETAIALPGGPGTLTEIALTWNLKIIGVLPQRPLILVGAGWKEVIQTLSTQFPGNTPPQQIACLHFVKDAREAARTLSEMEARGGA
jgi:uncharacterized protein (TIGR00725 family)